ncbi:uncharacterized protein G6M90_00g050740 [Metarhizium brunneum]|uniref:Uncharacterized protein n=1 Tax=Metarhizium brunneum TaxID=500148 RepID=A0A7D5UUD6_9HYPO|nr:hypothetical protein G6M90_00g050740 [Metarhizium brunneum]
MDSAATNTAADATITTKPALAARSTLPTTNLGALTTTFTPADDCMSLTNRYFNSEKPGTYYYNYGFTCNVNGVNGPIFGPMAKPTCFPESFASAFTCEFELSDMVTPYPVYSPGLMCPHGYGPSCTISQPAGTASDAANATSSPNLAERKIQTTMLTQNEFVYSGYACDTSKPHGCVSTVKLGGQVTAVNGARGVCFQSTALVTRTAISDTRAIAWGPRVLIVQPTPGPSTGESSKDDGTAKTSLSPGIEAAIAVSIPLGLTIFGLAIYILVYWKRKRAKSNGKAVSARLGGHDCGIPELEGKGVILPSNSPTDQSDVSYELPGDHRYLSQELESITKPVELGMGENN